MTLTRKEIDRRYVLRKQGVSVPCSRPDPVDVFWSKVEKTECCWLWNGTKDSHGYGITRFRTLGRKNFKAHRISWWLIKGSWPKQTIDHLCRVRNCINPDHLEDVSLAVNVLRAPNHNKVKTHCKRGHPFVGRNLYMNGTGRNCMACNYLLLGYTPSWDVTTGDNR